MSSMKDETTRLFRFQRTMMKMLKDFGYLVGGFEINMTRTQFIDKFGENVKREDLVIKSDQVCEILHFFICG